MKVYSQERKARRKRRDKRNFFRAIIIFTILLALNLIWDIFLDPPKNIIYIILGIVYPALYGFFYYYAKKVKNHFKINLKNYLIIPIFFVLLGISWYSIYSLAEGIGNIIQNTNFKEKESNQNVVASHNPTTENKIFNTEELKFFFINNENLCKATNTTALLVKTKCNEGKSFLSKKTCDQFYKSTLNAVIRFISLIFAQIFIILVTERYIYPKIRHKINPNPIRQLSNKI